MAGYGKESMHIQYGNMNPFSDLMQGLSTGMQLNSMRGKKDTSDGVDIPEPLLKQDVDVNKLMSDVKEDVARVENTWKEANKLEPKDQIELFKKIGPTMKSEVGKALFSSNDWQSTDYRELNKVMSKISKGDETATDDISLLRAKLGKNSKTIQALDKLQAKGIKEQQGYNSERYMQLFQAVDGIDKAKSRLQSYKGTGKTLTEKTQLEILKEPDYWREMWAIDPKKTAQLWKEQKDRRSGNGAKPTSVKVDVYDPKTKTWDRGRVVTYTTDSELYGKFSGKKLYNIAPLQESFQERVINKVNPEDLDKPVSLDDF